MIDKYELLTQVCGLNKIVCVGSMYSDLSYYYNWNLTEDTLNQMVCNYNSYYSKFWNFVSKHRISDNESFDKKHTSLINIDDGVYFNVTKVDFQRAFTNYVTTVVDSNFNYIFKTCCEAIARLYLPSSAKKFLYNYTLTNLLVNMYGKKYLYELREKVYSDVMYICSFMGTIIKSEIDGAYVITKQNSVPVFDVVGQLTTTKYRWLVAANNVLLAKGDKITVKGLGKRNPNVFYKVLERVVGGNNNDRDRAVDDFFFSQKEHVLDWSFKTKEGNDVELMYENMDVQLSAIDAEQIVDLNNVLTRLNRDKYFYYIKDVLSTIFELIG